MAAKCRLFVVTLTCTVALSVGFAGCCDQECDDDSLPECPGSQSTPGPNAVRAASEVCLGEDCTTPKRTLDAIAKWIATTDSLARNYDHCGRHRFALAAEQLIGPAEAVPDGDPLQGACWSGCVQFGLIFTAIAKVKGIPTEYVGTVREDTLALLQNGCWPTDYDNGIFQGHFFSRSWNGHEWLYYDPAGRGVAEPVNGVFTKEIQGTFYEYHEYITGCDPWSAGIHNMDEFRDMIEAMYCPNQVCDDPNGTCPNP